MDAQEAKNVLIQEQQERVARCTQQINELLKEASCRIQVSFVLNEKGNFPQVQVVPLDS